MSSMCPRCHHNDWPDEQDNKIQRDLEQLGINMEKDKTTAFLRQHKQKNMQEMQNRKKNI